MFAIPHIKKDCQHFFGALESNVFWFKTCFQYADHYEGMLLLFYMKNEHNCLKSLFQVPLGVVFCKISHP